MLIQSGGSGILVDEAWRAGKADDKDVLMPVAVKVVDPAEKMIGVGLDRLRFSSKDFVLFLEVRPAEPIGAVDGIDDAITVDITDVGALGKSKRRSTGRP